MMREELKPEFLQDADRITITKDVPLRDAATLLVIDTSCVPPRILTGVRKKTLTFMPGLTVFPGGGVEPQDKTTTILSPFHHMTQHRLNLRSDLDERENNALAIAALRETFEETGVLFENDLQNLHLVARAITPPLRPRRYDTRFFMIERAHSRDEQELKQATDLEDIAWFTLSEILEKPLAFITRQILNDIAPLLNGEQHNSTFPFYFSEDEKYYREWLS